MIVEEMEDKILKPDYLQLFYEQTRKKEYKNSKPDIDFLS